MGLSHKSELKQKLDKEKVFVLWLDNKPIFRCRNCCNDRQQFIKRHLKIQRNFEEVK